MLLQTSHACMWTPHTPHPPPPTHTQTQCHASKLSIIYIDNCIQKFSAFIIVLIKHVKQIMDM